MLQALIRSHAEYEPGPPNHFTNRSSFVQIAALMHKRTSCIGPLYDAT